MAEPVREHASYSNAALPEGKIGFEPRPAPEAKIFGFTALSAVERMYASTYHEFVLNGLHKSGEVLHGDVVPQPIPESAKALEPYTCPY